VQLADTLKVKSNDDGGYFARALRVVGQDLHELIPHQLEIVYKDQVFEAQAKCDRKRAEKKNPPEAKSGLKNVFHKLATYRLDKGPEAPDIATYEHSYGRDEISRLDRAGLHRRTQAGKVPDINQLGEALRTIGRIIDAADGQLVRIFRDQRRVAFDYVSKKGETVKTEMTRTELFKAQQSYYENRSGSKNIDLWKGHD
jgi:hypothetical protein